MASDMTIESAMTAFLEYQMRNMYTSIPAQVIQVRSGEECRVDVKPLINMVFPNFEDMEWATIPNVPVMYPASRQSAFTFPIEAGDFVLLVFSQSCIDVFKAGDGTAQPPSDYRTFNMRDAVAIPGISPFGLSINKQSNRTLPHSTQDAVIVHNIGTATECEIRMKPTGEVKITSPIKIEAIAPIVNVTASTSAAVSAPISTVTSLVSAAITAPIVTINATTSVAVTTPSFTWAGNTVAVV